MEMKVGQGAEEWATMTYGSVMLGDQRRRARAVQIARALGRQPAASLPAQLGSHSATKAAYRLIEGAQVSYDKLMRPHLEQTKKQMQQSRRVLLIQDMTEVDYQHHPKTSGLGRSAMGPIKAICCKRYWPSSRQGGRCWG